MPSIIEQGSDREITVGEGVYLEQKDLIYWCEDCNAYHLVAPDGWFLGDQLEQAWTEVERQLKGDSTT